MKKKLIIAACLLVGVSAFLAVLYTADWREIQSALSQMTMLKLAAFLAVTFAGYFSLFTWRWKILLGCHGHNIPFQKLLIYKLSGFGISFITPTQVGGEPVRIYFLNHNHGVPLKEATASVLLDKLIEISSFVAFVASGVILVSFSDIVPGSALVPIGAIMLGLVGLLLYVFKRIHKGEHILTAIFNRLGLKRFKKLAKFEDKIMKTEQLLTDFVSHEGHRKNTLPFVILISISAWCMTIIEYKMLASFLGFSLSWFESFLVATIPLIAYLLPVPAGLGMLEGAQVAMFSMLGYSSGLAIAVVVLVRLKEIFFSCIGFVYTLSHGVSILGSKKNLQQSSESSRTKPRSLHKRSHFHTLKKTKKNVKAGV
ncbi:MAG: lysylphosphatidylglycerol synthase transmembrane domain-containing protein [Candidatus Gracilibacteria bacterium]|nr:lysylphosphatidylglycerol synthase transmembrane domain-containing protein [Candidatus Gracilibacteria bacterium]